MTTVSTKQIRRPVIDEPPVVRSVITEEIPRFRAGRFLRTQKLEWRAAELRRLRSRGFRLIESRKVSEIDGSDRYRIIDVLKLDPVDGAGE